MADSEGFCRTTYVAEACDYGGSWFAVSIPRERSADAVKDARDYLARSGYSGCGIRVLNIHTHQDVTVLQEREAVS